MKITIRQLASGLAGIADKAELTQFELDELPTGLRERAQELLSPESIDRQLPDAVAMPDSLQYEIEYSNEHRMKRVRLCESACAPELLDLLDELRDCLN